MAACMGKDALSNWRDQAEEVQALGAIFGDSFRVLAAPGVLPPDGDAGDSTGGMSAGASHDGAVLDAASLAEVDAPCSGDWQLRCSLLAEVPPPGGSLRLLLPEADREGGEQGQLAAQDADASCAVRHLPPICLQLQLGPRYPSDEPPGVRLSALWLSAGQAAELEAQLAALWQEQGPGAPICYTWADWLSSSALQHLGAELALALARDGGGGGDAPGGSDCGSDGGTAEAAEALLVRLMRYDALQEHAAFARGMHTCGVCFEERPGSAFVRLDGCRHAWCAGCLGEQARIHVAEGGLEKLRCPNPKCGAPLPPGVLQRLLTREEFERWEQLTLQRTLDTMPDAAFCPRCGTVAIEDDDSCAQCSKCLFVFCSLCAEGWHPGTACVSSETKLAMVRRKMAGGGRAAVEDLRRQEQDLLSLAQIEKTSKRCPRCGTATQKAEGCNKMSCGGCGAYWCWRCGKEIDGYRHFRSGDCILFDEAEILRWEAQWEEMQAAARVWAAGMRNDFVAETAARGGARPRASLCPCCGQANHKLGQNNLIGCWSCGSHFCYCCRAVLRGRGACGSHFGPRGCKQHSPD